MLFTNPNQVVRYVAWLYVYGVQITSRGDACGVISQVFDDGRASWSEHSPF